MTKPFQAGHAAENGTVAADLAALGWTAAPNILEARFGWFNAAGGGDAANAIQGRLGAPWSFATPGVSIKPFPCGLWRTRPCGNSWTWSSATTSSRTRWTGSTWAATPR